MKSDFYKNAKRKCRTSSCTAFLRNKTAILILLLSLFPIPGQVRAAVSLSLSEAIEMAARNSFSIESSKYDSLSTLYQYKAAKSLRFPSLSLDARSSFVDNIPTVEFPMIGSRDFGAKNSYQADLRLNVALFTGGKISRQIKISSANLQADAFALEAERSKAAYDSRRAYLSVMLAEAVASAADASLKRINIIRSDVQNLYENGLADSIDILEAELAYQQVSLASSEKHSAVTTAVINLANLLGLPGATEFTLTEKISPPGGDPKDQPVDKINRVELKMLDNKIRAAEQVTGLNSSEYFPSLSGFAGYSYGKPNRDYFNGEWDHYWVAGLALNWNLNLAGKTTHNVKASKQAASSARMQRNDLERTFTIMAETTLEKIKLAYQTVITSEKEHNIAREKYRLATNKQKAGLLTVNRLLEIEAELTLSEQQYRASIINYYIAKTEHLYAIGSEKIYGGL
ncbi:MAG: TolC family protein [Candidatus Zixiibacteriota bacterium]